MIHVLGSINIDYSCAVEAPPRPGETIIGKDLFTTPGGKGVNQAVAAQRAGSSVIMTEAVGTDEISKQALSCLAADDVDTSGMAVEAIDTVGAGDTFAGYLGSRLEHGDSLAIACNNANHAAAIACTKSGAQTAIPRYEAINKSR